ncbi:unnamed protein product, partial [Phaeothamnion confervicola]
GRGSQGGRTPGVGRGGRGRGRGRGRGGGRGGSGREDGSDDAASLPQPKRMDVVANGSAWNVTGATAAAAAAATPGMGRKRKTDDGSGSGDQPHKKAKAKGSLPTMSTPAGGAAGEFAGDVLRRHRWDGLLLYYHDKGPRGQPMPFEALR